MNKVRFLFPLAMLLSAAGTSGQEPITGGGTPTAPQETDGIQRIAFFAKTRPVFLELHIKRDRKPFRAVWDDYLRRFFQECDLNHDHRLDAAEVDRLQASAVWLDRATVRRIRSHLTKLGEKSNGAPLDDLARIVSQNIEAIRIETSSDSQSGVGGSMFTFLDRDRNNRLAKTEVLPLDEKLHLLDFNEDEFIFASELNPFQLDYGFPYGFSQREREQPDADAPSAEFLAFSPDRDVRRLLRELITRYDTLFGRQADHQLSRQEMMLPSDLFERFDANRDEKLDLEELSRFVTESPPTVELQFRIGTKQPGQPDVEWIARGEPNPSRESVAGPVAGEEAVFVLDGIEFRFTTAPAWPTEEIRKAYVSRLKELAEDDGSLDVTEAKEDPIFRRNFKRMDQNADGKITKPEVAEFLDQWVDAEAHRTTMHVTQTGRTLFAALDEDGDQRLGLPEMYAASDRFARWDRNGDGELNTDEIPTRYLISIAPGVLERPEVDSESSPEAGILVFGSDGSRPISSQEDASKPLWFHRMNRNGDAYLSSREFLGPQEVFQRLDADGDRLIDVSEAARFAQ